MSIYIGKVKISWEQYPTRYTFGVTIIPQYRMIDIHFGKRLLQFWYRKDMIGGATLSDLWSRLLRRIGLKQSKQLQTSKPDVNPERLNTGNSLVANRCCNKGCRNCVKDRR